MSIVARSSSLAENGIQLVRMHDDRLHLSSNRLLDAGFHFGPRAIIQPNVGSDFFREDVSLAETRRCSNQSSAGSSSVRARFNFQVFLRLGEQWIGPKLRTWSMLSVPSFERRPDLLHGGYACRTDCSTWSTFARCSRYRCCCPRVETSGWTFASTSDARPMTRRLAESRPRAIWDRTREKPIKSRYIYIYIYLCLFNGLGD